MGMAQSMVVASRSMVETRLVEIGEDEPEVQEESEMDDQAENHIRNSTQSFLPKHGTETAKQGQK